MLSPRRIAVIGAGASGLTAIKCCKEEGMDVTCFEKTENFGGRWHFRKHSIPGVASVMKSTVSLHSKEMIAFSDFPPPKSFPNYMHNTKMLEYLQMYAQHFDLSSHIQFQNEVVQVFPAKDFDTSGKWLLKIVDLKTGKKNEQEFDGVMICTGRLSHPYIPTTPNRENFKGKVIHTQSLKTTAEFEDLNVLIIGSGNSAMDAAVDISILAKQVYLSTRSGTWVLPKVGPRGLPFDMILLRKHFHTLKRYFNSTVNSFLEKKFQHEVYNLKPNHRVLDARLIMNDIIPDKILTGRVLIKGNIKKFEENAVVFEGEQTAQEIDVVIFATGYEMKIPILDDKLYKTDESQFNLYKKVFPLGLKHSTLAVIGFVECQGPTSTVAESQSRWAARIFSGKLKFPSEDILKERLIKKVTKYAGEDYMEYMNELAEEYGVKPYMSTFLFKDFYLFWSCFTGPFTSYQYRLSGPHKWNDARKAIFECYDRVTYPLSAKLFSGKYFRSKSENEEERSLPQKSRAK
ncbi:flavin-containing monooxygenase 5-like [Argiope bruennichi]|uniref:flavin-containing monooxygenase 5-like n=1 Tax=Argiope bruennichi TaxID=94029 RepID=UPI002494F48B|nr:flavin-containing monooxygenase 5-like [Argiope bruennichi]